MRGEWAELHQLGQDISTQSANELRNYWWFNQLSRRSFQRGAISYCLFFRVWERAISNLERDKSIIGATNATFGLQICRCFETSAF